MQNGPLLGGHPVGSQGIAEAMAVERIQKRVLFDDDNGDGYTYEVTGAGVTEIDFDLPSGAVGIELEIHILIENALADLRFHPDGSSADLYQTFVGFEPGVGMLLQQLSDMYIWACSVANRSELKGKVTMYFDRPGVGMAIESEFETLSTVPSSLRKQFNGGFYIGADAPTTVKLIGAAVGGIGVGSTFKMWGIYE